MQFSELGLAAPLLKAVEGEGYTTPTPIQAQAIPAVMAGSDILGIAQTGTGKTAAFALPILHRLAADRRPAPRKGCRVLVLSPTRELASQIAESFETYGRHLRITTTVIFGGVGYRPQIQAMARGVDVLVATPGRLIDHIGEGHVNVGMTEIFVLDEADQMLDLGFVKPIRQIVGLLPQKRQSLFFSATMPKEIAGLANDLLRSPVKIAVTPVASTAERITQRVIHIEHAKKRALLVELLSAPEMERTLIFARTKRGADRVAKHLETAGLTALAIHGNKSQNQRQAALAAFKNGRVRALVATDIAARGIDIDAVSHVINFELPEVPEAYVHRIGRTARAGAEGKAISLCDIEERDLLRSIERLTGQSIPAEDRRGDASIAVTDTPSEGRGNRGQSQQRNSRNARPAGGGARRQEGNSRGAEGGARRANGGSRPAEGGSRHANGGSRTAEGGSRHANGDSRRAEGGARHANGGSRTAEGGARHADSGRRTEGAPRSANANGRPANAAPRPVSYGSPATASSWSPEIHAGEAPAPQAGRRQNGGPAKRDGADSRRPANAGGHQGAPRKRDDQGGNRRGGQDASFGGKRREGGNAGGGNRRSAPRSGFQSGSTA
jgi:ATP-dependent RNA helicase RhlE